MASSAVVGLLRVLLVADSAEFEAGLKRGQQSAKAWEKDLKSIGNQAKSVGEALTKTLTLPLVGLGAGAIKMASDFESSFAGVRKTVDATEPEFEQLAQGLRDMAKEIPVNVNELNRVAEAAGQLGIKKEDILQFTRTMADLGVTTNLTADEAATATAQIQNIFGAAGVDVDRFGSTLVALGNAGASTEKDIIQMGLRIAGAGTQVGLTQAQVLAFASALSSVGIESQAGGTAISRAFLTINDAVMAGGPELEEFARVAGMSADQFKQSFEQDAAGAMVSFISGLSRIKGEGENVNQTLKRLELGEIRVRDALMRASGAGALLTDQLALGNRAWQENTALTKEAEQRYTTFESQLQLFWNQVRDVGIELGTALLPTLRELLADSRPLIESLASMAKWFGDLPQPVRTSALAIAALAAAAGPAIWAVGQLALSGSALVGVFKAGGILAGVPALIRGIGVAAASAAPQLLALTVAAGAVVAVGRAVREAHGLMTDRAQQAKDALANETVHARALAEASRVAGREITDLAEAHAILRDHASQLRAAQQAQAQVQTQSTQQTKAAAPAVATLSDALKAAHAEATGFTQAQMKEIEAGRKMGLSTKDLTEAFNKLFPAAKASEQAIEIVTDRLEKSQKAAEKATEAQTKFRASISTAVAVLVPYKTALEDQGTAIQNIAAGLEADGTLRLGNAAATAEARKEAEELARVSGGVLAPAIRDTSDAIEDAIHQTFSFGSAMREGLANVGDVIAGLPATIARAFEGGGGIVGALKSIGVQIADAISAPIIEGLSRVQQAAVGAGASAAAALGGSAGGGMGATVAGIASGLGGAALAASAWGTGMAAAGVAGTVALGAATLGIGAAAVGVVMLAKKFSGVSKEVKEARGHVQQFEDAIIQTLTPTQMAEAGGERWAAVTIAVRDAYIATGRSSEEAEAAVARMWESSRQGPEAAQAAIAEVNAVLGENQRLNDELAESNFTWEELQRQAEEFGVDVAALGPQFASAKLNEKAASLITFLERARNAGADWGTVMMGTRDEIGELIGEARRMGIALPENMRPFIEDLLESGNLLDEQGNKITDISDLAFTEPLEIKVGNLIDEIRLLIQEMARIPARVDTEVHRRYTESGNREPDMEGARAMATGGIVTRPTLALIGERGPEAVIPLSGRSDTGSFMGMSFGGDASSSFRDLKSLIDRLEHVLPITIRDAVQLASA